MAEAKLTIKMDGLATHVYELAAAQKRTEAVVAQIGEI
jgi:hypothetical protein